MLVSFLTTTPTKCPTSPRLSVQKSYMYQGRIRARFFSQLSSSLQTTVWSAKLRKLALKQQTNQVSSRFLGISDAFLSRFHPPRNEDDRKYPATVIRPPLYKNGIGGGSIGGPLPKTARSFIYMLVQALFLLTWVAFKSGILGTLSTATHIIANCPKQGNVWAALGRATEWDTSLFWEQVSYSAVAPQTPLNDEAYRRIHYPHCPIFARGTDLTTVFMTCKTPNTVAFAFVSISLFNMVLQLTLRYRITGPGSTSIANPSSNLLHPSDEIVAFLANQSVKATFFLQWRKLLLRSELYKGLPYQNRPIDVFEHRSPSFIYGWDMSSINAVYRTGPTMDGEDDDIGIMTIHSDYHYDVPFERADKVIARLSKMFGK
uniref:Uncharacterized protein n=1 Tax=Moniliophthora roreri TaxID=221103 RepID=A0A0W0FXJ0_MONRR